VCLKKKPGNNYPRAERERNASHVRACVRVEAWVEAIVLSVTIISYIRRREEGITVEYIGTAAVTVVSAQV
jgi:hypothetical protein